MKWTCLLTALLLLACNEPNGDPTRTDDGPAVFPADLDTTRGTGDTLAMPDSGARTITR